MKNKFDDTIIVELRSSNVPGKVIAKDNKSSLRGIRIGPYKTEIVKVSHVGKDVQLNESLKEFVYELGCVTAARTDMEKVMRIIEETIRTMKFVNSIGSSNG